MDFALEERPESELKMAVLMPKITWKMT